MANKFQIGVQERLEQEAVLQRRKSKGAFSSEPTQLIDRLSQPIADESAQPATNDEPPSPAAEYRPEARPRDIGEYLRREPQRLAKNKTFYLDSDVINAVKSVAIDQGVTDSKLVNDILRRVLGL